VVKRNIALSLVGACAFAVLWVACTVPDRTVQIDMPAMDPFCGGLGDACDACVQAQCSTACSQCSSVSECIGLYNCIQGCASGDSNCFTSCTTQYPALDTLNNALMCVTQTCAAACSSTTSTITGLPPGAGGSIAQETGGGSGTGGSVATPGSIDDAIAQYAAVTCGKLRDCAPGFLMASFGRYEECVLRTKIINDWGAGLPGSGLTVGAFQACSNAWTKVTCAGYASADPPECSPKGTVAVGMPCNIGEQCATGFCQTPSSGACGVCAPISGAGDVCFTDDDCAGGMWCTVAGTCQKPRVVGESCSDDLPCRNDLGCYMGKCADTVKTLGGACDATNGLYCAGDQNLACYTNNRCIAITWKAIGDSCGVSASGWNRCQKEGICSAGVCVAGPADDAACDEASGEYCEWPATCSKAGTCVLQSDAATCK
jgi:hypothetical protein